MRHFALKYLREEVLPTPFCPGCGCGIVANCFFKAVEELGYEDLGNFVFCSGIGCSSWIPSPHFKADTIHTLHGRSIPVATGIKMVRPDKEVVVFGGDGDLAGIGLSHLIHAARRNLEIKVIMVNNMIYGMTGGQTAPTTPQGSYTSTTPYGNPEPGMDVARLVADAGASYVARWTVAHAVMLKNAIRRALERKGFAYVEALSHCPTQFGRRNKMAKPAEMMKWMLRRSLDVSKASGIDVEGRILVGVYADREKPGFVETYKLMIERAGRKAGLEA
ncbi:MAG: 2-oxoacid:ferredoxin oxidoreductase subunit beta [Thermoprotei archaeon]|nr:MAG: 2-oxoacid:ferredoxin oxidoreductase subunit beta [Thermoprotei archaeon]RLF17710.1 MAG: 2-oxoacid:ferredoxin oxidoreductase subunit beta [Thermoprotei archaeon]